MVCDVTTPRVPFVGTEGPTGATWLAEVDVVDIGCVGMCWASSSALSNEVDGDRDSMANKPRSPSPVFDGDIMA